MTMKSLLLGAAAGIAAVGAAQAADLPMTKGEAVEYVKVCSAFGPGFFYIPGSDTCLKIGGEIRADYRAFGGDDGYSFNTATGRLTSANFGRGDDRSAFNTQARIWFDARTQTDWGLLRSYFQINADSHPISHQGRGNIYNGNTFSIDKAYIQFGGLTAGYAHSFFGFYDNDYGDTIWAPYYAESSTVNLLAYTFAFGGGFQATLSIEDGRDHRVNDPLGTALGAIVAATPNTVTTLSTLQGGQQVPDVVAQLRYDASWGSLALQGALHQTRSADSLTIATTNTTTGITTTTTTDIAHENKWGYAVGGTALFKLPFIDGGHFVVEGQYADGATEYLGANSTVFGTSGADLYIRNVNGAGALILDQAKGWSIVGELGGNITPVLNANLVGSYIDLKSDNFFATTADSELKEYTLAGNMTYTIVKGLSVAGEVSYTHSEADLKIPGFGGGDASTWQFGVRLKRTF